MKRKKVAIPTDLAAALARNSSARTVFEKLPPSHQKQWVEWIEETRTESTREKRVDEAVSRLAAGG